MATVAMSTPVAWAALPVPRTPRTSTRSSSMRRVSDTCARALGLRPKAPRDEPIRRFSSSALGEDTTCDDHRDWMKSLPKIEKRSHRSKNDFDSSGESWSTHSTESTAASLPGSVASEISDGEDTLGGTMKSNNLERSQKLSCSSAFAFAAGDGDSQPVVRGVTSRHGIDEKTEFRRIVRMIGERAEFKYRTVRDTFLSVDSNGDGRLDLQEVRAFFQRFGLPDEVALHFFRIMDRDGSGDIDWREFMSVFAPAFKNKAGVGAVEPGQAGNSNGMHRHWKLCPSVNGQRWYLS